MLLLMYHEIGDAERSRTLVRRIDGSPAGAAIFLWLIDGWGNALFFDLDDGPNFMAKLDHARIDPASFEPLPRLSTLP